MAAERPIGYWLKLVDRLIDERFAATLDEHGVTRRQWQLLNVLGRGAASRAELDAAVAPFLDRGHAQATPGDTPTVPVEPPADGVPTEADGIPTDAAESTSAELDELIESEWVSDSQYGFVLTPRGQQSFERLSEVVSSIRAALAVGIDEVDYDTTTRTLELMARNLGWNEQRQRKL